MPCALGTGRFTNEKLVLLQNDRFFKSEEKIEEFAAKDYSQEEFESFKKKIEPILIDICENFLSKPN